MRDYLLILLIAGFAGVGVGKLIKENNGSRINQTPPSYCLVIQHEGQPVTLPEKISECDSLIEGGK